MHADKRLYGNVYAARTSECSLRARYPKNARVLYAQR